MSQYKNFNYCGTSISYKVIGKGLPFLLLQICLQNGLIFYLFFYASANELFPFDFLLAFQLTLTGQKVFYYTINKQNQDTYNYGYIIKFQVLYFLLEKFFFK